MATVTSAAVTIPSFTGLKAGTSASKPATSVRIATSAPKLSIKASLKDFGVAVAATAASALLAGNVLAAEVKLGGDDGSLAFVPGSLTVKAGETINFTNNAGFPHNIVFDEDEVPAGVNADKISQPEYLNAPGEVYSVTLTEKGTYKFYCEPHQGAGMKGEVTVE